MELRYDIKTSGADQLAAINARTQELSKSVGSSSGLIDAYGVSFDRATKSVEGHVSASSELVAALNRSTAAVRSHESSMLTLTPSAERAAAGVRSVGNAASESIPKVTAAGAAIRALDGQMNIRAVERWISGFQVLGPVLQAAFPLFGAIAFVEIAERGIDKLGELYNAWDPVIKAQEKSLKYYKESAGQLDQIIAKTERLTLEEGKRRFGTQFEIREQGDNAVLDAKEAQAKLDKVNADIAAAQARVTAGTRITPGGSVRQPLFGPGIAPVAPSLGGLNADAQAAREQLIGLGDARIAAQKALNLALKEQENAQAGIAKDQTDKARESARKVDAINKQIEAIQERSRALADRAELGTGPLADIEVRRRAENRRYATEQADLAAQQRENRLGGPDTVRTPQSSFDALGRAQSAAHTQNLASLDAEEFAARTKAAEDYADALAKISQEWDKWDQHLASDRLKNAEAQIRALVKAHEELVKATEKSNKVAELGDKADESGLQLQFRKSSRLQELAAPIGSTGGALQAAQNSYQERLRLAKAVDDIEQRGIERAAQLSALKSEEYDKDLAIAQEKLKLTQEEGEAADYAIKVAEIERKRLEDARNDAGKVFDAIIASGHKSFGDFASGLALQQGRAIFQNVTEGLFKTAGTALGGIIPQGGPLASIFKGTILEPREVTALDVHTSAMIKHAAALTAAAGRSVGGGGVVGSSGVSGIPGLSTFGSDTNGLTGGGTLIPEMPDDGAIHVPGIDATSWNSSDGLLKSASKFTGSALMAGAGAFTAYSGFKAGGARGALEGSAGIATMAASVLPLISTTLSMAGPIGMIAAAGLGLVTSLMGDPKVNRQNQINKTLQNDMYLAPTALNVTAGVGGGYADSDRYGTFRDSNLSPYPTVQQPYYDRPYGVTIPGRTTSQFGGSAPQVTVNYSAFDSKSIADHHEALIDAVVTGINKGSGTGLVETLRDRIG